MLQVAVMALLYIASWALSHSYRGIFHDAGLYTLQALSHMDSHALSQDVFLRFGSQDRYTIFSRVYAAFCRLLGVETAAASLTFLLQMALIAAAWGLAASSAAAGPRSGAGLRARG